MPAVTSHRPDCRLHSTRRIHGAHRNLALSSWMHSRRTVETRVQFPEGKRFGFGWVLVGWGWVGLGLVLVGFWFGLDALPQNRGDPGSIPGREAFFFLSLLSPPFSSFSFPILFPFPPRPPSFPPFFLPISSPFPSPFPSPLHFLFLPFPF